MNLHNRGHHPRRNTATAEPSQFSADVHDMHKNRHVSDRVQELDTPTTTCTTGTSSTLSKYCNRGTFTVISTVTTRHQRWTQRACQRLCPKLQTRHCMSTGTSTPSMKCTKKTSTTLSGLQLRNFHRFQHDENNMHDGGHVNNHVQELEIHVDDLHNRDIDHQATPRPTMSPDGVPTHGGQRCTAIH